MSKIRVYEYAKKNNVASKEVIRFLKEKNVDVSNHMSTISDNEIKQLDEKFNPQPKQDKKKNDQVNQNKQQKNKNAVNKPDTNRNTKKDNSKNKKTKNL